MLVKGFFIIMKPLNPLIKVQTVITEAPRPYLPALSPWGG